MLFKALDTEDFLATEVQTTRLGSCIFFFFDNVWSMYFRLAFHLLTLPHLSCRSSKMADAEDIQPLVCDNGTGMVKVNNDFPAVQS